MSLFGGCNQNRGNECQVCSGTGRLRVVIVDWRDREHKRLPGVLCDCCDGRGYFATAASQTDYLSQQP